MADILIGAHKLIEVALELPDFPFVCRACLSTKHIMRRASGGTADAAAAGIIPQCEDTAGGPRRGYLEDRPRPRRDEHSPAPSMLHRRLDSMAQSGYERAPAVPVGDSNDFVELGVDYLIDRLLATPAVTRFDQADQNKIEARPFGPKFAECPAAGVVWIAPLPGLARRSYPANTSPAARRNQHAASYAPRPAGKEFAEVVCFTSHLGIKKRP